MSDELPKKDNKLDAFFEQHKGTASFEETLLHTKIVRISRILLPIIGGVLVLALVILPSLKKEDYYKTVEKNTTVSTMENTKFFGVDKNNNEFSIVSDQALRDSPDSDVVTLINPVAEITLKNNKWLAIKAEKGRYDRVKFLLDLKGAVNLFYDDGYIFDTQDVIVNLKENLIYSEKNIIGHGVKMDMTANSFKMDQNTQVLVLQGPANIKFYKAR